MKFVVITKDPRVREAAQEGFHPADRSEFYTDWREALEACFAADMLFVDLLAVLTEPHKIAGYEAFALAKMEHPIAKGVPLVLISVPPDYDLDFMVGWQGFVYGYVSRPVTYRIFRRASTWI
jgi:hypothetical protein